jgi:hypothetical protein
VRREVERWRGVAGVTEKRGTGEGECPGEWGGDAWGGITVREIARGNAPE